MDRIVRRPAGDTESRSAYTGSSNVAKWRSRHADLLTAERDAAAALALAEALTRLSASLHDLRPVFDELGCAIDDAIERAKALLVPD